MEMPNKEDQSADEKAFSLKGVLQNLKAYQVARGEIKPSELHRFREHHGEDTGRVFGSLLSGQSASSTRMQLYQQDRKRRRRRRRTRRNKSVERKKQKLEEIELPTEKSTVGKQGECTHHTTLFESNMPSQKATRSLLASSIKTQVSDGDTKVSIGSLGLLATEYSDSENSNNSNSSSTIVSDEGEGGGGESDSGEEVEDSDGWEKGEGSKEVRGVGGNEVKLKNEKQSDIQLSSKKLEVPDTIKAMFEEKEVEEGEGCGEDESSEAVTGLGFFQTSDTEDRGGKHCLEEGPRQSVSVKPAACSATSSRAHGSVGQLEGVWDEKKGKWRFPPSRLGSYVCSLCGRVGHLAQDCTVSTTSMGGKVVPQRTLPRLKSLYSRGHNLATQQGIQCVECGLNTNLVCCLDCRSVYCDGRSHLSSHLHQHPSHTTLYSCKLRKLIKCCKPTCEVVNVYDLLTCSQCLSKAFSKHYSMFTATWSGSGLKKIQNAICCEEHFHWHRINCPESYEESFITREKLSEKLISEFFF